MSSEHDTTVDNDDSQLDTTDLTVDDTLAELLKKNGLPMQIDPYEVRGVFVSTSVENQM